MRTLYTTGNCDAKRERNIEFKIQCSIDTGESEWYVFVCVYMRVGGERYERISSYYVVGT